MSNLHHVFQNILDDLNSRQAAKEKPIRHGANEITVWIRGVEVWVTYDTEGKYYPATATTPAEYPGIVPVSADIGGVCVWSEDGRYRLVDEEDLILAVEDHL